MANKKVELPFGWIVRQSKSYPDRVYYFNINSGASTWEFPDLLGAYVSGKATSTESAPVLTAAALESDIISPQKVPDPTPSGTIPPRKPAINHVLPQRGSHAGNRSNQNTSLAQSHSSTHPALSHSSSSAHKKACQNSFHNSSSTKTSSKQTVQSSNVTSKGGASLLQSNFTLAGFSPLHVSDINHSDNGSQDQRFFVRSPVMQNTTGQIQPIHHGINNASVVRKGDMLGLGQPVAKPHLFQKNPQSISTNNTKTPTQVNSAGDNVKSSIKERVQCKRSLELTKPTNSPRKRARLSPVKFPEDTSSPCKKYNNTLHSPLLNNAPITTGKHGGAADSSEVKYKHRITFGDSSDLKSSFNCPNDLRFKLKMQRENGHTGDRIAQRGIDLPKSRNNDTVSKYGKHLQNKIISSDTTCKKNITQELLSDNRKVVRSINSSSTENRSVSKKESKVSLKTTTVRSNSPQFDLTVSRKAADLEDGVKCQTEVKGEGQDDGVSDAGSDLNNNTEFKLFIGDKDKLLSIQSWINNLQEGARSESSSVESASQVNLGLVNDSVDSGYVSTPATQRGWPGEVKKSDITSREIVAMELDECLLTDLGSAVDDVVQQGEENMDIDEVLTQVRQEVSSQHRKECPSFTKSWETEDSLVVDAALKQTIMVVVDTNVLISNLDLLEDLKDHELPGNIKPCLFIPWIVLRELDALKETVKPGKPNTSLVTQQKSRRGISFLKSMFYSKHPRVLGQTPKQAEEAKESFQSQCNDDVILQACLQCHKSYTCVVLLSNDNNLAIKSMVVGIPAFNAKDVMVNLANIARTLPPVPVPSPVATGQSQSVIPGPAYLTPSSKLNSPTPKSHTPVRDVKPAVAKLLTPVKSESAPSGNGSFQRREEVHMDTLPQPAGDLRQVVVRQLAGAGSAMETSKPGTLSSPVVQRQPCIADRITREEKSYTLEELVDDLYCKMRTVLIEAMGKVLKVEMQKAYDNIWEDIVYKKPPWTLNDILQCWKKHFMAVFGNVFSRRLSKNVDQLINYFSSSMKHSIDVMYEICTESGDILQEAATRNIYGPCVPGTCSVVKCLKELCHGIKKGNITVQSVSGLDLYLQSKLGSNSLITQGSSQNPAKSGHMTGSGENESQENCHISNQSVSQTAIDIPNTQTVVPVNSNHTVPSPYSQTGTQINNPHSNGNQSAGSQTANQSAGFQPDNQTAGYQPVNQSAGSQPASQISAQTVQQTAVETVPIEIQAGQLLEHIWRFIFRHCDEFDQMVSKNNGPEVVKEIERLLNVLVSSALELRNTYTGLLALPVEDLRNREREFTALCNICNNFFTKLNAQEECPVDKISPVQLLILYSKPEHRGTLEQFGARLEEMLNMMYQCLLKLDPSD